MADYRAIGAACAAVVRLLQQSWRPELFDGTSLQFQVYRTNDFAAPMDAGVSLFLYNVTIGQSKRNLLPRSPGERVPRPPSPLDLHFLLTPWAQEASLEQEILGWILSTMEASPILPPDLLNLRTPNIFGAAESTEIVLDDQITPEQLSHIWSVLPCDLRVSIPYVAKGLSIGAEMDAHS